VLLLDQAKELYRTELNPIQKYEQTIWNMASRSSKFGQEFSWNTDRYVVPTLDEEEAKTILLALDGNGYINVYHNKSDFDFRLTVKGFEQAEELRRSGGTGPVVFVAAALSEDVKACRTSIVETVKALGYEPYVVDQDPHHDLIDLRIYENIRRSRFVVADLTYNRQSVYYEVGFAHGLDIDVILTCREDSFDAAGDDFKRVHFDLNHRQVLVWKDEAELKEKLERHVLQSFGRYVGEE
jgi:hypothetical protein